MSRRPTNEKQERMSGKRKRRTPREEEEEVEEEVTFMPVGGAAAGAGGVGGGAAAGLGGGSLFHSVMQGVGNKAFRSRTHTAGSGAASAGAASAGAAEEVIVVDSDDDDDDEVLETGRVYQRKTRGVIPTAVYPDRSILERGEGGGASRPGEYTRLRLAENADVREYYLDGPVGKTMQRNPHHKKPRAPGAPARAPRRSAEIIVEGLEARHTPCEEHRSEIIRLINLLKGTRHTQRVHCHYSGDDEMCAELRRDVENLEAQLDQLFRRCGFTSADAKSMFGRALRSKNLSTHKRRKYKLLFNLLSRSGH